MTLEWQLIDEEGPVYCLGDLGAGDPYVFKLDVFIKKWGLEAFDSNGPITSLLTDTGSFVLGYESEPPPFKLATRLVWDWLVERNSYLLKQAEATRYMIQRINL